jgi:hypothetical protein
MGHRHVALHRGTDRGGEGGPQFLAITQAGKVIVNCVSLYMGVIRIGDAAEYSRFSLGDPGLETDGRKV